MGTVKSVQLFFQEGTSDKLYNAQIVEDAGAYTVAVQWGRRGSKLQEGNKALRVTRAKAEATFDRIVREKRSKGYEEIAGNVRPAAVAPPSGQGSASKAGAGTKRAVVGHAAQLLTAIEDDELDGFLADDAMIAQQKLDGIRVLVTIQPTGELIATNRNGQPTQMAGGNALAGLAYLPKATVVDGEILDDAYWIFDVLAIAGTDVRTHGYLDRYKLLDEELEPALTGTAQILPLAKGAKAKRTLHDKLRRAGAEGIVFKQRDAPYSHGRVTTQRKHKFIKSADVIILENAGNAYKMAVMDGSKLFECGRVFAGTTNASRKDLDARLARGERPVAEVRYLYATDDHQLFQPVFVNVRDDKLARSCLRSQLLETSRRVIV
ncbi:MAG TPA: WGR domain-containing protein [Kofleriaceae bacterium]|nr:WGR domain-containing protein [Kofleriaceae bacterium]